MPSCCYLYHLREKKKLFLNDRGGNMKLHEKMAFKLGTKFGTAIYGGNMTAEEKRQLERKLYKEKLEEERLKEAAARRAASSSYVPRECCANCFYFSNFMGHYCTEHQYAFTTSEEVNNVRYTRVCSSYRKR